MTPEVAPSLIAQTLEGLTVDYDGTKIIFREDPSGSVSFIPFEEAAHSDEYLRDNLLKFVKTILEQGPPSKDLKLAVAKRVFDSKLLNSWLGFIWNAMEKTQSFFRRFSEYRNVAKDFENSLFYIADRHNIIESYARSASQKKPGHIFIER